MSPSLYDVFSNKFSHDVYLQKYSMDGVETWADTARRVVESVCSQLLDAKTKEKIYQLILTRKFIPGGRYLYAAGREWHQVNNCFLFRAEDNREGWSTLMADATASLMSGGGIGASYSRLRPKGAIIRRTGGVSTGALSLMQMINEAGRHVMQGGARRSAIFAGLNWAHADVFDFMVVKDHSEDLRALKAKDLTFPLPMELTNISVEYDTDFFIAIEDSAHPKHELAKRVWIQNCRQAFSTAEPGMSFNFMKDNENLRNACQPAYATVLTPAGISTIGAIREGDLVWSGTRFTKVIKKWSTGVKPINKYDTTVGTFVGTANHRVISNGERTPIGEAETVDVALGPVTDVRVKDLDPQDIMDGLVLGDGSVHRASNNLVHLLVGAKDYDYATSEIKHLFKRERPGLSKYAYEIETTITAAELPKTFQRVVPDRFFYGSERTKLGFLRGLFTANGTVSGNRVCLKQSSKVLIQQVQCMLSSLGVHAYITTNKGQTVTFNNGEYPCKQSYDINITSGRSIFHDSIGFIQKYKMDKILPGSKLKHHTSAVKSVEYIGDAEVFEITVEAEEHTYWTGGMLVSNCCEIVSDEDGDKCNLGTLWISRFKDKKSFADGVNLATMFLLCGGIYSHTPNDKIKDVGSRNNRIGLGLGGIHEWLMLRGEGYEVTPELHKWLSTYEHESDSAAFVGANQLSVAVPKGVRAIAPNGSIGILAETTTSIEPLFCKAYKRRYFKDGQWIHQYVVDGTVKRLLAQGVKLEAIQDAHDLTFKQRVKFQADVQNYVDMAISSTCNMPTWGGELNNESTVDKYASTLLKYAKRLRGFTVYPDGCRQGQPLERVALEEAMRQEGKVFEEKENECANGVCGI